VASQALAQNPVVRKIQTPPAKSGGAALPSIKLSPQEIAKYIARIPLAKEGRQGIKHFERRPVNAQPALAGNIPDIPVKKTPVKLEVHGPEIPAEYQPSIKTNAKTRLQTLRMIALLSKGTKLYKDVVKAFKEEQLLTQGATA
jgi:hypothetical protein